MAVHISGKTYVLRPNFWCATCVITESLTQTLLTLTLFEHLAKNFHRYTVLVVSSVKSKSVNVFFSVQPLPTTHLRSIALSSPSTQNQMYVVASIISLLFQYFILYYSESIIELGTVFT